MEVLVAAIGIPVVLVTAPVLGSSSLGSLGVIGGVAGGGFAGSGSTVLIVIASTVAVAVLSPLVIIGTNLASVVLVVVVVGLNRVVGFAPPVVGVLAVSLLGPCVVIVARKLGSSFPGSLVSAGSGVTSVALSGSRGVVLLGGLALLIEVTAPALTAPLVVILVVPFIVGLSAV